MELRDYQAKTLSKIYAELIRGHRAICVVSGCGSGKSVMAAALARYQQMVDGRTLFIVHRRELCEQIKATFEKFGVNMDLCTISMVQTASRHLDDMPDYDLIICDECHHSTATTYRKIFNHYPKAILIGFTATPVRLNRGGLGDVYDALVSSVSTSWLIERHYLAPYKYYSVSLADASGLHIKNGEFDQSEVLELMENNTIYGDTVRQWERLAKGKKTIVYCASVEAARQTAEEFYKTGYNAEAIDGTTEKNERRAAMRAFRDGEITILCNCELFGEGLDVPDCECVVLLRPTQSLALHIQQSMRSMRYYPGKTAIIIDHVGNCYRHGLPDDPREWSLTPKKVQETTVKIRICPKCFAAYPPKYDKCPYCGYAAVKEIRTEGRKTVDVDLVEVKRRQYLKDTPISELHPTTFKEVKEIQEAKEHKFFWVLHHCIRNGIPYPSKYEYLVKKFHIGG